MSLADQAGESFATWARAADVALLVADPDGVIEYASTVAESFGGLAVGGRILDVFHPTERVRLNELIDGLNETGDNVDLTAQLACCDGIARFLITRAVGDTGQTSALICGFRDVTPQGLHERQLQYEIDHDDLTGVLTRAAIIRGLEARYSAGTDNEQAPLAALFVDLDDFKGVNDGYGHLAGDEVLKVVADRLQRVAGAAHQVARIGGDEFLIVLGDCPSVEDAVKFAEVVAAELLPPVAVGSFTIAQRVSIGVAIDAPLDDTTIAEIHPSPSSRVEQLLAEADMAMYVAKQHGVSIAVADDSTRTWSTRRLMIDRDLQAALRDEQLEFYYQPIVDLEHGKWMAAEALLRWDHPELGMLPPELVIERAEVIGCIDELTRYTIERVTSEWAELQRRAPVMFHHQVAVNASARQLNWDGFVDTHLAAIRAAGLTPAHVLIEVTESTQIELHDAATATLNELARQGTRICLDDFGVGYSALAYFTQFAVHAVKVDRSLVSELRGDGTIAETVLRGVVRIADDLGARVVGEGVETEVAAEYCRSLGMAVGQGYYFDRPMPFEAFCELAKDRGLPRTGDRVVLPNDPQIRRTAESAVLDSESDQPKATGGAS